MACSDVVDARADVDDLDGLRTHGKVNLEKMLILYICYNIFLSKSNFWTFLFKSAHEFGKESDETRWANRVEWAVMAHSCIHANSYRFREEARRCVSDTESYTEGYTKK